MSNYIEYNDKIAFHPGYYLKEIVEASGLTQADFARRMDTTPKNLSILLKGEQAISLDMAMKLSRMLGTSVEYWLNLQKNYEMLVAEFKLQEELQKEKEIFKFIDYSYFCKYFGMPELPRKTELQIEKVRSFLGIATLKVLQEKNLSVNFRSYSEKLSLSNIINSNIMVQIAINIAVKTTGPIYNKKKFEQVIQKILSFTCQQDNLVELLQKEFLQAGVIFVALPNLKNSGINGATKKIGNNVMLMVNDRRGYADTFWFSLYHEIGHIMNGDYQITFKEKNEVENNADSYAENMLVPEIEFKRFIGENKFDENSIRSFAEKIDRDPGIVLGRLQKEKKVAFNNQELSKALRRKFVLDIRETEAK